jgi:hypothetical protein
MNERNVFIQVSDIAFYARGTPTWWHAHVFVNDAAEGEQVQIEVGGWDRTLCGPLHPITIVHRFPLPERLILDVEKTVRAEVQEAWESFLKSLNQQRRTI